LVIPSLISVFQTVNRFLPIDLPMLVSEMISTNQSPDQRISDSFNDIFEILRKKDFNIVPRVDCPEVFELRHTG
jgi:hypothetical protein